MVLKTAAFGEDGAEDAPYTGGVERAGIARDDNVQNGGFAGFVGDGQTVFALEAGDFSNGLGAAVDEAEEFKIKLIDGSALLTKGVDHVVPLLN